MTPHANMRAIVAVLSLFPDIVAALLIADIHLPYDTQAKALAGWGSWPHPAVIRVCAGAPLGFDAENAVSLHRVRRIGQADPLADFTKGLLEAVMNLGGERAVLAGFLEDFERSLAEAVIDVVVEPAKFDAVIVDQPREVSAVLGVGLGHLQ